MGSGKVGGGKGRKTRKITRRKKKQLYSIQAVMVTTWSPGCIHKCNKTALPDINTQTSIRNPVLRACSKVTGPGVSPDTWLHQ